MRILHCIPTMEGGGAERQLAYLAKGFVNTGWECHVALMKGGNNFDRLAASGAIVHQLTGAGNYDPRILSQLLGIIREVKPDVIQTWILQMDILGGLAAMLMRVPFVTTERVSAMHYKHGWKSSLRLFVGNRAITVIANSEAGRAYWTDNCGADAPVHVIRNIVPFEEIQAAPSFTPEPAWLLPEDELILFAGRYDAQKNLLNLASALKEVLSQRPTAVALLFGEGQLKDELIAVQQQSGFGNRLRVSGYTANLWSWLKRANVFVSVSRFEGNPNTVLEAVACRRPVVVSDIAEHREFLDERSAYFVPTSSPNAIADGILKALSHPDEAKRKAVSAHDKISHLSLEAITREYQRVIEHRLEALNLKDRNRYHLTVS